MAIKPYIVQRRMMELGRVRLGEKGAKGEPKKLSTLRFTSASKPLLDALAARHGGEVRPWEGAPEEGFFEVTTATNQIDIILPPVYSDQDGSPTAPYSQFFENWSGGGCMRRCDGETEALSGKPCMCAAAVAENGEDARTCKITTRVSFMIPDVPGLGVWRLESHGWNAAVELPGTLEVLLLAAAEHKFIPAVLRAEPRTKKTPGEPTRRFIVPVIELPSVSVNDLVAGNVPLAINAPKADAPRPELPAGPEPIADEFVDVEDDAGWGDAIEPEVLVEKPKAADKRKLTSVLSALAAAAPEKNGAPADWTQTAENLMQRRYSRSVEEASKEELLGLVAALEAHLDTLRTPA